MNLAKNNKAGKNIYHSGRYKQREKWSYILLTPQIIGFLVFTIIPLLWAISRSWYFYNGIDTYTRFVGWENFIKLFGDKQYWNSVITTFQFAIMKIPVELPLALILAVFMNRKFRGVGIFRTMYYMPHIISVSIRALVFANLFRYFGFINSFLQNIGLIEMPVDWFATKKNALSVLVLCDIWGTFGVNVLYFLAALQNVPEDMYESAKIDGAGRIRMFFSMTLPMIAPTLQIILMLSIIGTLGTNEIVLVLTNGAPSGLTYTVKSYVFSHYAPGMAVADVNVGYGCAMSLVTGIILTLITVLYNKFSARMNDIY